MSDQAPAGWYPDPDDSSQQRYWDGSQWTDHRTPATPTTSPWGQPQGQAQGQAPGQAQQGGWAQQQPGQWGQPAQAQWTPTGQVSAPTSGSATTALVLGILSLVMCGLFTGIPAMIVGRNAKREIKQSGGRVGGEGVANAGIITGLIGTIISGLGILFFILIMVIGLSASTTG